MGTLLVALDTYDTHLKLLPQVNLRDDYTSLRPPAATN